MRFSATRAYYKLYSGSPVFTFNLKLQHYLANRISELCIETQRWWNTISMNHSVHLDRKFEIQHDSQILSVQGTNSCHPL